MPFRPLPQPPDYNSGPSDFLELQDVSTYAPERHTYVQRFSSWSNSEETQCLDDSKSMVTDSEDESTPVALPFLPSSSTTLQTPSTTLGFSARHIHQLSHVLHGLLVILHLILLGVYSHHLEHRTVLAYTQQSQVWTTVLSASLQAFYVIYASLLVVFTQKLGLLHNLQRRQSLTTMADVSDAWAGLGSAFLGLWHQTKLPVSVGSTIAVTLYLLCVLVLHIASSTIMQLETFNGTVNASVPTRLHLPSNFFAVAQGTGYTPWPVVDQYLFANDTIGAYASQPGLSGSTLYDVLPSRTNAYTGRTLVNSTTINATCGLMETVSDYVFPGFTPFFDQIQVRGQTYDVSPGKVMYWLTTTLEDADSIQKFNSPINYTTKCSGADGSIQQNYTTAVVPLYLAGCYVTMQNNTAALDASTNELLEVPSMQLSSPKAWDAFPFSVDGATSLPTLLRLDDAPESQWSFTSANNTDQLTLLDVHLTLGLGTDLVNQTWAQFLASPPPCSEMKLNASISLGAEEFETMIANMVASMMWIATTQMSDTFGFEIDSGKAWVEQSVLQMRLNINAVPLVFAFIASVLMLALEIHIAGFKLAEDSHINRIGILEGIWLAARHPTMRSWARNVQMPTVDGLRAAGLHEVCLAEELKILEADGDIGLGGLGRDGGPE
ncbi:hypothetical protein CONPUDRAFT_164643 [Coniophora puteana RWD-64-598 SS2]|uniref:Uncharacterized protein n=1 Tax=Coniophora puteana (strain RWD-64-598) TaxID=741705 RepID=A0A5M3MS01_CONPW|nr:uncharacterized protein CONPUDRAFT_164643 [Coniophora puteana RWD-64-598 SS2]EIW81929.1 hypothetical protein CONPUDRAFT_164643 [Coniophora puteana RWD-64-598 SS2]